MVTVHRLPFLGVMILSLTVGTGCQKKEDPLISLGHRTFRMAVTPFPADFTEQELSGAYDFIRADCDMVSHHFDEGIPYEEAFTGVAWPTELIKEIETRRSRTPKDKKVFLSSSALNFSRKEKAEYSRFSTSVSTAVKAKWQALPFNDPKVIDAYLVYLNYLIKAFDPIYINYAVESNVDSWDPVQFTLYLDFVSKVYKKLKEAYPSIPILLSLMTNEEKTSLSFATSLLPYTDYLALSAYPYTHVSSSANGSTNPAAFPEAYFGNYLKLAPEKPFGFAETGYIAEDLIIPAFQLNKQGKPSWQTQYLEKIVDLTTQRKGKFVIWFCHKDYDAGVNTLKQVGAYQELFGLWKDIGFRDENNKERPSYAVWKSWFQKKLIE